MLRGSSLREQLRQHGQHVVVPEPSLDMDQQELHDAQWAIIESFVPGGREAKVGVGKGVTLYNTQRPHFVHKALTPDAAYWTSRQKQETDQTMQSVA